MKNEIKHLSVSEIVALHDKAISLFGGLPGCPDVGRIDALMGRVVGGRIELTRSGRNA